MIVIPVNDVLKELIGAGPEGKIDQSTRAPINGAAAHLHQVQFAVFVSEIQIRKLHVDGAPQNRVVAADSAPCLAHHLVLGQDIKCSDI